MELLVFALAVAVVALAGIGVGLVIAGRLTRWSERDAAEDDGGGDDG
jgi:hypothetical protein